MPNINCPFRDCAWTSGDVSDGLALTTLQLHAQDAHPPTPQAPTPNPVPATATTRHNRNVKYRLPTVTTAGTGEDWKYFTARWEEYVAATGIIGEERVLQLLECCDEELRKDLTRNAGKSLAHTAEDDVLKAIKLLAVREENVMVARHELFNMHQDRDEPVRSFGARLRGQAGMCKLFMTCSSDDCDQVNCFANIILQGILVHGLEDAEIRLAILQDKQQNMTLEEIFQFIEAKEAGKRSILKMQDASEIAASRSTQYRRLKKEKVKPPLNDASSQNSDPPSQPSNDPCLWCGKVGHGAHAKPEVRKKKCPAFNTICTFCAIKGHVISVCRKKPNTSDGGNPLAGTNGIAANDSLFTLEDGDQLCAINCTLDEQMEAEFVSEPTATQEMQLAPTVEIVSEPTPTPEIEFASTVVEEPTPTSQIEFASTFDTPDVPTLASTIEVALDAPGCSLNYGRGPPDARGTNTVSVDTLPAGRLNADVSNVKLDHHVYDQDRKVWVKKRSKPQPFLNLELSIHPEDYAALGLPVMVPTQRSASLQVMADTGCQSCLISFKLLRKLGIYEKHLVPASLQMNTATCGMVDIIGCVAMRLTGTNSHGHILETRQIVYVTSSSNKLFLCREACEDLGLISRNFPSIGETSESQVDSTSVSECDCLKRMPPPPKPTQLPFPATRENRALLEKYLRDYYASSAFNTCTHQPMPKMNTLPMRLMIDPNAIPKAHHKPIPVALHWQDEVKEALDADVRMGLMEPVPIGAPVTWLHQMVITDKKDGKPRRTVDMQSLNAHAIRETHHTQSPFHLARAIPRNTVKTTFDNWNSFHGLGLHPDDRHLTTFITPWGRYRYKVGPQGYAVTGDAYTRRLDAIVSDIPRKVQCVDDSCLWDSDIKEAFFHAVDWIHACSTNGVTLNPKKFVFAEDTIKFAGFEITQEAVRPCQESLDAILNFPRPQNISDMRSWYGLLNQVAYAFSIAEHMQPFRHLMKPGTPFVWSSELDELFEESKQAIIREIEEGVRIFDKSKPTCLATDWSKTGIGFWLFQKHCSCESTQPRCCPTGWKVTMVGSRFTQHAESNYAPVEGEALAVVYALDKARFFTLGCHNLTVAVDHKPLLGVFCDRSLDMPNRRLCNLKEKTLRYRFKMVHIPGMKNKTADALSRYPSNSNTEELPADEATALCEQTDHASPWHYFLSRISSVEAVDSLQTLQAVTWNNVKQAMNSDPDMCTLLEYIEHGFPQSGEPLPQGLRPYQRYQDDLFAVDGVALYRNRVIIPPNLREDVLDILHAAHQGVTSMISRADSTVFWPGITPAITKRRERCQDCNRMAPSQPSAPPTPTIQPTYPFQAICADYFKHQGRHYLAIVDRYSNYPIAERAKHGAKGLIKSLKRIFATFGIPDEVATDGGSEFTASSTKTFLRTWGVDHRLSSVAFPHSNCRAEIGVKPSKE